jgi:DNA adenine methylase
MGGKTAIADKIALLIPGHACFVEVFAGSAALFFAKPRSRVEVLNDINSEIVNLFRVVQYHRREFIRELSHAVHARKVFEDFKAQPGLTDIQRAARYFFILKTAFGGKGGTSNPPFGYGIIKFRGWSRRYLATVSRIRRRLEGVTVECLDFADCIQRYDRPTTFFYLDPPYIETAQYRETFDEDDHRRLARALTKIRGKFLLSINDHPLARGLYRDLQTVAIPVAYSVSRDKSEAARRRTELLIANYPIRGAKIKNLFH